ncbi:hypothetical protein OSB04_018495 [Centaurea solstitialis]|uniref:Uncharacterized protein n=1 Tax=Centaurea solstitialis TaxID=347529 RepID=A0AA38WJE1_9ASTR|nr:hypothetical protein OSB04_018495 [Centaurea solstitialis]
MKKACDGNNNGGGGEALKQKERHIVSWSQEEDDILREQISIHGTDNWTIIASKFKDKTTRQCRRRWFTYLNSDFKKGGWSPEEDMLLCEAQRIFGNRWTEIAKVVSGRTDNAVKNRFSTLCKKRAKHEALAKENNVSYINANNKRTMFHDGQKMETSMPPMKIRRKLVAGTLEDCSVEEGMIGNRRNSQQIRTPFTVLNGHNINDSKTQLHASNKEVPKDAASYNMGEGTFLKKDDPKIIVLMQQAELLSSLALKVHTEKTDQSFENAWKVVQNFLKHTKESDELGFNVSDMGFQLENFKDFVEDIRSCNDGSQQYWRQPDLYQGSPSSSEYSTGSTILSQINERLDGLCEVEHQPPESNIVGDANLVTCDAVLSPDVLRSCDGFNNDVEAGCPLPNSEFNSPLQVTPLFRSMAAGIPSPQFSESERHFLLKTLGMELTPPNPSTRTSQPPPCKRALLHCL